MVGAVTSSGPPGAHRTRTRTALALLAALLLLTTTGWTSIRTPSPTADPLRAELTAWHLARTGPRADAPPHRVALFFARLGPHQRARLAARFPLVVGNLHGAPTALRYRANRTALTRALQRERHRAATARLSADGRQETVRRIHRLRALTRPGRQILAFDPAGAGRVVEVLGDLDRAERVSVVVPGVGTGLLTFERSARRYSAPLGMARSLFAAQRALRGGGASRLRTAVVAWADYTAPRGVGMDSVTGRLAAAGARRLAAFAEALPGVSAVALFCHSYGSVVCGVAARSLPSRVTDIAVAGSPGMRAGHVSELGGRARVWAVRDGSDWIADVPHLEVGGLGHGADPVAPEFGARVVSATGALGHSGYFEPGTETVRNFAALGVGAYRAVRCVGGDDRCRRDISGEAVA
ncbi:alpha/beta hydrolase [Streptomyces sp. NPDC057638]|uniref:alpha/beta hydrolase n=1 Tax=Streptomyces sp. NPDC057638 TaxID=3346190 RepID=UPI00368D41D2